MDKGKQKQNIYPTATRGVLANEQVQKKYQAGAASKVRDYSPATIIMQAVIACIVIAVASIGGYIYYYAKIRPMNPNTAAYSIAKRVAEFDSSELYDVMESETTNALQWCKEPIMIVTYDYALPGQPKRTDTTEISTAGIRDLSPIYEELVTKADTAKKITLNATCPGNRAI
jgi:hypothetical protein